MRTVFADLVARRGGPCRWEQGAQQGHREAACASTPEPVVTAPRGDMPWLAELAAEHDSLRRRTLLLQEQKVRPLLRCGRHPVPRT